MAKFLLELQNAQNWEPTWSYRLSGDVLYGLQRAIPEQTVPILLDARVIAVKATSLSGSPSWKFAGWVKPLLQASTGFASEVLIETKRLTLNETKLLFLDDLGEYKLKIQCPKWFPSFEVDIWSYIGPFTDTSENLRGRIRRFYTYTPNTTLTLILLPRNNRTSATLYNSSTATLYIGFNNSLTAENAPETLYPNGQWTSDGGDIGEIWIVGDRITNRSLQFVEYAQD